jgi:universal stress protein E
MKQISKVLVVVDPTAKAQPAVDRGVWLARQFDASVELFVCDYDQYLAGERFFDTSALAKARAHVIERHKSNLAKLAKSLKASGVEVTCDARWDHPLEEGILKKLAESKADVLVKDTHYHSAIRRSVFTNTDWNIIRECEKPLLLVKPGPQKPNPVVVAAVDPMHDKDKPAVLDREILAWADTIAARSKGQLHVFHAFDPAPAYAVSADSMAFPLAAPVNEIAQSLREQHDRAMQQLLQDWKGDSKAQRHVVEGDTREAMIQLIDEVDADLVVMGAVSRSALKRFFLGSTAERVLDHVPCDLLIIKGQPAS